MYKLFFRGFYTAAMDIPPSLSWRWIHGIWVISIIYYMDFSKIHRKFRMLLSFWSNSLMGCGASASIHAQLVVQPSLRHPLPRFPPSLINSLLVNPGGPFRIVNITGMAQVKEIVENKNVPDDGKNVSIMLWIVSTI
jgi:hypothetical protein